ncbi:hypothetical protein [Collimonas pratensis]|uniref:hypothetical protein n=1 Tax=Collimonas pratensis TaxID=279113 RepID=UPI000781C6D8|nr:hypothetical protein [Collimonas pratensis]
MARPRTPSNVLQMRGAFDKNPKRGREREGEPEPNGEIGEPPESLSEDAKKCWFEITGLLAPGVLCRSDRLALEMAASLLAQIRGTQWLVPAAVLTRYETLIGKFGMTPSDRSKVSVPKTAAANPFAKLIKKGK